jgi:predicted DCC family thiol-disulfide oxidoreductase YuxK
MGNQSILLFDNHCGVCHWLVRFIIRHDTRRRFRFAALGSPVGVALCRPLRGNQLADTVVLVCDNRLFVRSDAVIETLRLIGGPWRALAVVAVFPKRWRDVWYDMFSARRTSISRHLGLACPLPTIEERTRFIDPDSPAGLFDVT